MAKTVADAAAELQAIAGPDPEDPATAGQPDELPDYLDALSLDALDGARLGVIANSDPNYQAAIAAVQALGAETVLIPTPQPAQNFPQILTQEFKRDLNAYLARLGPSAPQRTLADVIAYNDAHAQEALKFGQTQALASQAVDLSDPAQNAEYVANRDGGRAATRAAIDGALTRGTADPGDDLAAIMTPSGTLTGTGARAGYPQLTVPAGYSASGRAPVNISFNGAAYSEATLLALGYAYEQATQLRRPPSEINPSLWRCVPGSAFPPRSCAPGRELLHGLGKLPRLPFSLETATVADLEGSSSEDLTKAYLARIALTNTEGPSLNAVRIVNPDALRDARELDRERRRHGPRGPLHGIPALVKDNLDVAGLPTTAGSVALEGSVPGRDSAVVARLRAAGAVILGKTNLTEFANFLTNGMPSGYSSLGGQVLNPYNADATPSGSSSGSGSAAAAGLAPLTIGTETSGSIVSPSAANGIVGLRPTVGLVSRAGIVPISASQDTAGPMAKTVADAAAELQAIAGPDPEDPATAGQPDELPDYLDALSPDALEGVRLGVLDNANANYQAAIAAVRSHGAETVVIPTPQPAQNFPQILTQEFKRDLNAYLARLPQDAPMKTLADIIAYNESHAQEALKFGQTQALASEAVDLGDPAQNAEYVANRDGGRAATRAAIDGALTRGTADPGDDLAAIMTPSGTLTGTGARAGYPQLTVPAGYDTGGRAPVNISFNGTAYSEDTLLALGYAYEQATQLRRPPSEINPSLWRCVPGSAFGPRSCPP
jgi:amidase